MKNKLLFSILIAVSFYFISDAQELGFPVIHNYLPKEYNNTSQIFGLSRDNRGIMYFGVGGGVMEYDGVSWRNVPNSRNSYSYDLIKDKKGRIYVGANEEFGFLDTDSLGNTIYKTLTHLIGDTTFNIGAVWSVNLTSKFVYFRTYNTIFQYTPSTDDLRIYKAGPKSYFSVDFVYNDTYYTSQFQHGLMKIENNEITSVPKSNFFNDINSLAVLSYDKETLMITSRTKGLSLYRPDRDSVLQNFNVSNKDFIADNNIYSASNVNNGNFVLGSLKKGAMQFDKQGEALQQFQESNLLQDNEILKITTDANQNLWFGLNNGISKAESSQDLSYWDKNAGLKGIVESVIRYNNIIYIATSTKVYFIDKTNKIQEVQNIPTGQAWCFLETKNIKSLLVGVSDGIYEIKDNKATKIYFGSHISELYQSIKHPERILAIDNSMLISLKYEKGKWTSEGTWKGITKQSDRIAEDENGDIWLGNIKNGVTRIIPNYENITLPTKVSSYVNGFGVNVPFKFKNKIIFGTEKGLYSYNSKTDHLEPFSELGDQFCKDNSDVSSLNEMPDGTIWISPSENKKADIGYLKPSSSGGYDWVFAPFRRIPEMSVEAFYVEPSGIAWIGGTEGLYRYDKNKDSKNYNQNFNCLIRKITTNEDSLLFGGNTRNQSSIKNPADIKYEYNNLRFEFAAPFFDSEDKTLYSYQLVGYDKEWSNWSRKTIKEYSKIPEGKYTFRVKARNIYDIESTTDTCKITILPPWFRTAWAYVAYLILLVALIWFIVRLNSRRLMAANINLEKIVEERTLKITQQKAEILEKVDELQIANATKDKFFSIIAHDLRGPFSGFLGLAEIMDDELPRLSTNDIQEIANSMKISATTLFRLLNNLLEWAQIQDGSIPFNPAIVQLKSMFDESIEMLLQNAKNKEIEINNNVIDGLNVFVDHHMLHTVIRNIVSNAIKYSPKGGSIVISAEAIENQYIEISISDSGIGMTQSMIDDIFRPDVKTNRKGTEGEPSSGIGLLLCKEFIEKNGGKIWIESQVGKGSTFHFTVPSVHAEKELI